MGAADGQSELVGALAEAECKLRMPQTQEDCCAIVARITLTVRGMPTSEHEIIGLADGIAKGLFGEAFQAADDAQKWTWIDMCERALREAMSDFKGVH